MKKIENVIRSEMEAAGGQELLMPALQPKENWQKTGRWETLDSLFRFTSHYSKLDFALGPTHEEVISPLVKNSICPTATCLFICSSSRRNSGTRKEPNRGILRGREFLMKDFYSFHSDEKDANNYYEKMKGHYEKYFQPMRNRRKNLSNFRLGRIFSQYSHEYQTVTEAGEDTIYICGQCEVAVNKEIADGSPVCPQCGNQDLKENKSIEVGNIFSLKTKFSEPFDLKFTAENGRENLMVMGCYGIGLGRLMGTIAETSNDEKGIIWPEAVAPYRVHLIDLKRKTDKSSRLAENLYDKMAKSGIEVLFDDRDDTRAGEKFADADLLGIPYRVIVSEKTAENNSAEIKKEKQREIGSFANRRYNKKTTPTQSRSKR